MRRADLGGGSTQPRPCDSVLTDDATVRDEPTDSRHGPLAQLLIAWAPLSLILACYAAAQWINAPLGDGHGGGTNRLGLGLHVSGPVEADRALFGTVPSRWLQEHLVDGPAHWYDAAAALVYSTHFVSIPVVTAVIWFWLRDRFASWLAAVVTFTVLGIGGYVLYPAAPPWLASDLGQIGDVHRISGLGWSYLHLDGIGRLTTLGQGGSNPVAAMPSLHAGSALLIALFCWPMARTLWRAALAGYVVLMALTLVYTGEHYVVDVIGGWLTAGSAFAVGAAVRRWRSPHRTLRPTKGTG
jgi:membrane-associated phospholipid phosphatase